MTTQEHFLTEGTEGRPDSPYTIAEAYVCGDLMTHEALAKLHEHYSLVKDYYTDKEFESLMEAVLKLERRMLVQKELEG